jgi:ubiquinone/menaquinone biosynthesis C-methylase UbiE
MLNRANKAPIVAAVRALEISSKATLADLGFGGGIGLALLLGRVGTGGHVHGVDLSTTMLRAAARRFRRELGTGRLALHQAPIERLPMATGSIDGIITLNTLYFIDELAGALNECARVLRPGGTLVIGLADPEMMGIHPLTPHGFHVRPIAEVTSALHDAGLEVAEHSRVGPGKGAYHLLVTRPS